MNQSDSSASDRQLLGDIAGGDEQALDALYQRYSGPIFNYVFRLIREQDDAEDLLQEIFVAVWKGAHGYRGQAQVRTWLYRIAYNQAISWLRRHRPAASYDDLAESSVDDPEQNALETWRNGRVREALDRLSTKHRVVLELAFMHGMSYTEIAQVVGCPVGTVKSRMSYALRALNGSLQDVKVLE